MFFSERFKINRELLTKYGALDISLDIDMPFYIDPLLIFQSENENIKLAYTKITEYIQFLYDISTNNNLNDSQIMQYFSFNEIEQNWLGCSMSGNKGKGNSREFAYTLHNNIRQIINSNVKDVGVHLERIALLDKGIGKDKISDFTVNLIKSFLLEYTQEFAKLHLPKDMCENIKIDKAYFDFDSKQFVSHTYYLPVDDDYILLTPLDILRRDEQAINYTDMVNSRNHVISTIDNDSLRTRVNTFISNIVHEFKKGKKKEPPERDIEKVEKEAFEKAIRLFPELQDYYVKFKETDKTVLYKAKNERDYSSFLFNVSATSLKESLIKENLLQNAKTNAYDEAVFRITEFKRLIEMDLYKSFYFEGRPISQEADLQRLFKLALIGSVFSTDAEVNNGRGPIDFKISFGKSDSQLIEFKLAENKKLSKVFRQTAVYEKANGTNRPPIIVIFFFRTSELERVNRILEKLRVTNQIDKYVFIVNCMSKPSASIT